MAWTGLSGIQFFRGEIQGSSLVFVDIDCIPPIVHEQEPEFPIGFHINLDTDGTNGDAQYTYINFQITNQDGVVRRAWMPGFGNNYISSSTVSYHYPLSQVFVHEEDTSFTLCYKLTYTDALPNTSGTFLTEFNLCETITICNPCGEVSGIGINAVVSNSDCPDARFAMQLTEGSTLSQFLYGAGIKVVDMYENTILSEFQMYIDPQITFSFIIENVPDGIITVKYYILFNAVVCTYSYKENDMIFHNGNIYRVISDGTIIEELTDLNDTAKFEIISEPIYQEHQFKTLCVISQCIEEKAAKSICKKCNCENTICKEGDYLDLVKLGLLGLEAEIKYNGAYDEEYISLFKENLELAQKICCKC